MMAALLSPIGRWIGGSVLVAIVIGGGFAWLRSHYIGVGYTRALAAVAAQDAKAMKKAGEVKRTVDRCFESGGNWNVEDGTCAKK